MFEEKKVPTKTTSNALHEVYKLFFPINPFFGKTFSETSVPTMVEGEVVGFG